MNEWVTDKPDFKSECLVIAATKIGDSWDYSFFKVIYVSDWDNRYFALMTGSDEEWGDIDDLRADKYFVTPLLEN